MIVGGRARRDLVKELTLRLRRAAAVVRGQVRELAMPSGRVERTGQSLNSGREEA